MIRNNLYRFMATFFFISFWIMFAIAMGAFNQRDEAKKLTADFQGETLVCRVEEKH